MKSSSLFRLSSLAVGGLMVGFLATSFTGSPVQWMQTALLQSLGANPSTVQASPLEEQKLGTGSFQLAKNIRPAAKGESPEEAQIKQLPPPVPPGQIRRPSKAELLDKCRKNPKCQAKLQDTQQKGPKKPQPAAREESPEDIELKKLPKAVNPKARGRQPSSELMMPEDTQGLLSWFNPFQVAPVYGQSPVSINLTPGGPYISNSYMTLYGSRVYPNSSYYISSYDPWNNSYSENNPFAYLRFSIPATGTYLINVRATQGKAKLRHQYNGPIIDTWDFTAQPYGPYDYLTAEYLEQGYHYFYFWPDEGSAFYIYSASLESYP
ncbi:MAG: hypothetical protein OEZ05_08045 [Nitrospirota bacterium]|nr:hypothetical protein [Nitrospirota bacterium]MDH5586567.1 hypothetical protein [Nitrospirota bacterium]